MGSRTIGRRSETGAIRAERSGRRSGGARRRRGATASAGALLLSILLAEWATAGTITVVGADGADGASGVVGEAGASGGSAIARAGLDAPTIDSATAIGGAGGDGGASTAPSTPGGPGGDGGSAVAVTNLVPDPAGAVTPPGATATGGHGGRGGAGATTGAGGNGGDAFALSISLDHAAGTTQIEEIVAVGGDAGALDRSGHGGQAIARADHRTTKGGRHTVTMYATGGAGFNDPARPQDSMGTGLAQVFARGDAASSYVAEANATGGAGTGTSASGAPSLGGRGIATADVVAGGVAVRLHARGGSGAGTGGEALTQAVARALSGSVTIFSTATGVDGSRATTRSVAVADADGAVTVNDTARAGGGSIGGDASSVAEGTALGDGRVNVTTRAEGGRGGSGAGGAAESRATGSSDGAGQVSVVASAYGGDGADDPSTGTARSGAAFAVAHGASRGGGDVTVSAAQFAGRGADTALVDQVSGSTAGTLTLTQIANGGSEGGSARSQLTASNPGGGDLVLRASAFGGTGTAGGAAEATASGSDSAGSAVQVTARAKGGAGLNLGQGGGTATATAQGLSTAGGLVHVEALQEAGNAGRGGPDGLDSAMQDAVSGRTSGLLILSQQATAGAGGDSLGGSTAGLGGAASSTLDATNPDGGSLDARAIAIAGAGGAGSSTLASADGGIATASGQATDDGGADVSLLVSATGGAGGGHAIGTASPPDVVQGGAGGAGVVGPAFASSSLGGHVTVTAEQIGGDGGGANLGRGGAGAGSILVDAADGATSGVLTLVQRAVGGRGGDSRYDLQAVDGANASSSLTRTDARPRLEGAVEAQGGDAGRGAQVLGPAVGGAATASLDLRNTAGSIGANAAAQGGSQHTTGVANSSYGGATGGAAQVSVVATTERDGDAIDIGTAAAPGSYGAVGGDGGNDEHVLVPGQPQEIGGDGGAAISASRGEALGDASVSVRDLAQGGSGGRPRFGSGGLSGSGGSATSSAQAIGAGYAPVLAESTAFGGLSGLVSSASQATGGDAQAHADARGLGQVEAIARATGGRGAGPAFEGASRATALAASTQSAYAEARASGFGTSAIAATSVLTPAAGAVTSATVTMDASSPGHYASAAAAVRDPAFASPLPTLVGSRAIVDLDARPGASTLAALDILLYTSNEYHVAGTDVDQSALVDLVLSVPAASGQLALDLTDASFQGGGFSSLALSVALDGATLVDLAFDDPAAAVAYFSSTRIVVGDLSTGLSGRLVYTLTMTSDTFLDEFSTRATLAIVPEPTTGVLVLTGLLWIGARRRGGL